MGKRIIKFKITRNFKEKERCTRQTYKLFFHIIYEYNGPEVKLANITKNNNKRKFNETTNMKKKWFILLNKINIDNSNV